MISFKLEKQIELRKYYIYFFNYIHLKKMPGFTHDFIWKQKANCLFRKSAQFHEDWLTTFYECLNK